MLSYVYRILNQSVYEDLAMEEFDEMYDMFAAILSKGIGVQLKQGLYRDYRSCHAWENPYAGYNPQPSGAEESIILSV